MKRRLVLLSLLFLSGCGPSREALEALSLMQGEPLLDRPGLSYARMSGSAGDITLEDVSLRAPEGLAGLLGLPAGAARGPDRPAARLDARSVVMKGLGLSDGRPVVRDMVISGIAPSEPVAGMDARIGSLAMEGLSPQLGAFIASAFTQQGASDPPPFADWAFSTLALRDVSLTGDVGGSAGLNHFDLRLAEVSVSDLKEARIGRLRMAGLTGQMQLATGLLPLEASFDLGEFEISALRPDVFPGPLAMAFGGADQAAEASAEPPGSPLDAGYDRLSWSGMTADVSGLRLGLSPLVHTLSRDPAGLAIASDLSRTTLSLRADRSGGLAGAMGLMVLAMAGYPSDSIELITEGGATFDPARDITRISDYRLELRDVADLRLDMGLHGLRQSLPALMSALGGAAGLMADAPGSQGVSGDGSGAGSGNAPGAAEPGADAAAAVGMQLLFALMPLQLTDLDLSLSDQMLIELILGQQARASGQRPEALRADLVSLLQASAGFMADAGIDPAIAGELSAAMAGMAAGPGTLRLQLRPRQPFGLLAAMMTPVTKDSLGFSATFQAGDPAPAN